MSPRTDDLRPSDDDVFDALGLPPLGHNRPPPDESDFDKKKRTALADAERYVANANRWAIERDAIADEEQAGAAKLAADQLHDVEAELEALRAKEIEPYNLAIAGIRIFYNQPLALVGLARGMLLAKLATWLKLKRDRETAAAEALRREAEEARRLASEAITKAEQDRTMQAHLAAIDATARATGLTKAAARPPAPARVKGDYATKAMSLHSNWKARVIDEEVALTHYAQNAAVRQAALAAITKLGSDLAKACKGKDAPPPGLEYWNDERAQ